MRKPSAVVIGGVLLLLLVGAGAFWWLRPTSSSPKDATAATPRPVRRQLSATPPAPPRGALQVRGRVQDARGQPVAGIEVSATVPLPGETLSELPCDTDPDVSLASEDCTTAAAWDQALEMVASRRGAAFVLASTPSAADGTFTLEGLPPGTVAVWALGKEGSALEEDVATGTQDVKLVLVPGQKLSGRVVDEDGTPLPGTRLTVLHAGNARYFETLADAEGRFAVGPLPDAVYTLAAAHPGKLSTWLQDLGPVALEEDLVLHPPRRIVGQVLDGERPVPGVSVLERDGERIAVTDAQGRFTFDNLLPSEYALTAEHDGQRAFDKVEVTEHQSEAEVTLRLGTAFFVDATVRDTQGHPVANAMVVAFSTGGHGLSYDMDPIQMAHQADAEGHVRLGPLLARSYVFNIAAERLLDLREERTLARGQPPLEFVLSPAVIVEGQVTNAQGQPVPDAALSLRPPPAPEEESPRKVRIVMHPTHRRTRTFDATTDETGHFVLKVEKAMAGTLTVEAEGFLSRELQVQAPASGLRVALEDGATVRGTVTNSAGAPVNEVDITLTKGGVNEDDPEDHGRVVFAGSSGEDGHFTIRGVAPGNYAVWLRANMGGYERLTPHRVEVRGSETVELSLHLDLDGRMAGVVVDAQGQPLAGVSVMANAKEDEASGGRAYSPLEVKTGPDGRFVLEPLARDWDYELEVTKPGYAPPRPPKEPEPEVDDGDGWSDDMLEGLQGIPEHDTPKVVARAGNMDVRIVLAFQGRVIGRLVKTDGSPITRFSVNEDPVRDPRGAFTVFVEKPGPKHLTFQVPGLALVQRDVKVPAGRDVDLGDVRIDTGHVVRGRVVEDATGAPLEDVEITLELPPGEAEVDEEGFESFGAFVDVKTGPDGTFKLPAVESRPYLLTARKEGLTTLERPLGPTEDTLELRLQTETRLEVTARDEQGKPHPADLSLQEERTPDHQKTNDTQDGRAIFDRLEPGDYLVSSDSMDPRYTVLPRKVRVEAHRVTRLDLPVSTKGSTVVARWDERGDPYKHLALLIPGTVPLPSPDTPFMWLHGQALRTEDLPNDTTWRHVPPGPYTLLGMRREPQSWLAMFRQDVVVGTGDTQEVEVRPPPP